jgi:hypothetical protein
MWERQQGIILDRKACAAQKVKGLLNVNVNVTLARVAAVALVMYPRLDQVETFMNQVLRDIMGK